MNPGFRLFRVEVRNWGTFDERVHVLDLAGSTALLIGENGSGKSTLVDALLTLLVPRSKRNYNLSAGGNKKRERDSTPMSWVHMEAKTPMSAPSRSFCASLDRPRPFSLLIFETRRQMLS